MGNASFLFVPGDRPERFLKAWNSGAWGVILDLEDGVAADRKEIARAAAAEWLSPDRPVYVRVNGPRTVWFEADLGAVVRPGLRGVVLPKAETAAQVGRLATVLPEEAGQIPLVETALGVWNVREIAEAPRVERLAFGAIDLQIDAGIQGDGPELLYARSRLVLASRVAGIRPPLDGVTTALEDATRLAADIEVARRMGFGGKLCIHPSQVDAVNRGFLPAEAEVAWARRVLAAVSAAGTGAIRVDGEMADRPVVERAKGILSRTHPG